MSRLSFFLMSFLLIFSGLSAEALPSAEMLKEKSLVQAKLLETPNRLILAVNGMCCRNCAIGIGKKVAQVGNVDTQALSKGIHIDRVNGLLTVAVKEGAMVNYPSLYDAVRKAGYDPVRLYQLNSDKSVSVTNI